MNLEEVKQYWLSTDSAIPGKSCLCPAGGTESIEITLKVKDCDLVGINFSNTMPAYPTDYTLDNGIPTWHISQQTSK